MATFLAACAAPVEDGSAGAHCDASLRELLEGDATPARVLAAADAEAEAWADAPADERAAGLDALAYELSEWRRANYRIWERASEIAAAAARAAGEASSDARGVLADALVTQATAADRLGEWHAAAELDAEALDLRRELATADPDDEERQLELADALIGNAKVQVHLGRFALAEKRIAEARAIYDATQDAIGLVDTFNQLAELRRQQGRYEDAEASFRTAQDVAEAQREALDDADLLLARVLNNLGGLHRDLGDLQRAAEHYRASLDLRRSIVDIRPSDLATAELNLGEIYRRWGDTERAGRLYRQALTRTLDDLGPKHPEMLWFYTQQAALNEELGELDEALDFLDEALDITAARFGERHPRVGLVHEDLGRVYQAMGDGDAAEEAYRHALEAYRDAFPDLHPRVGRALVGLAAALLVGEPGGEAGGEALDRAEQVFARHRSAYPAYQVEALRLRAAWSMQRGDRSLGVATLERAAARIEAQRLTFGGGDAGRARWIGTHVAVFDALVEAHLEGGDVAAAFTAAERGRARVLVDRLLTSGVDLAAALSPDQRRRLAARRQAATEKLAEVEIQIATLERSAHPGAGDLRRLLSERDRAAAELDAALAAEREASPVWRRLVGRDPATLTTVREALAADEVLLLYHFGGNAAHLFVAPPAPGAARVWPLDGRRLDELLAAPADGAASLAELLERPVADDAAGAALTRRLAELWQAVVPREAVRLLAQAREAIVVPHGPLHALPFAGLVTSPPDVTEPVYWLDRTDLPALRYAASATALVRFGERARAGRGSAEASTLSVSDPCFAIAQGGPESPCPPTTSSDEASRAQSRSRVAGLELTPLPFTRLETQRLAELLDSAPRGRHLDLLQGRAATEAAVRGAVGGHRYLHLATHGIVAEGRGDSVAALALAPGASDGRRDDDGLLELAEIYELELAAELAVLSACSTQRGPRVRGEGVSSLARAFLVAGADRVVATLWQVRDAATAELMAAFFERLEQDLRAGRRPAYAASLHEAKRRLRREALAAGSSWSQPFYWAPFVLSGQR